MARFARPYTRNREMPGLLDILIHPITYDNAKARDKLGWQPQIDLAEGIARSAVWLRETGLLQ
jgi:nucleoside-diphosphate-sugar epimerase